MTFKSKLKRSYGKGDLIGLACAIGLRKLVFLIEIVVNLEDVAKGTVVVVIRDARKSKNFINYTT